MSNYFIISYDLRAPGRDYSALTNLLGQLGAVRVLQSVWVVWATQYNQGQLHSALSASIDPNDGLFVIRATRDAVWSGIDPAVSAWLQQNL